MMRRGSREGQYRMAWHSTLHQSVWGLEAVGWIQVGVLRFVEVLQAAVLRGSSKPTTYPGRLAESSALSHALEKLSLFHHFGVHSVVTVARHREKSCMTEM
jgi:hypothetical protein